MTYNVFSGTLNPTHFTSRTNTKILSSHFFAISMLNPNYDVINDVISGFAKVVVE